MSDGTMINGDVQGGNPQTGGAEMAPPLEALEYRLRRLEDAVAILQDTQMMEDRVAERVRHQLDLKPAPQRDVANLALDAGLRLLPMLPRTAEPPVAPQATVVAPTAVAAPGAVPVAPSSRPAWLVFETINDFRVMMRVFTDPRYRITRIGWLLPVGVFAFVLCSHLTVFKLFFVWNLVPFFGDVIDKVIDLFAAFIAFKVLMREVTRYREIIPDAPGRRLG
jgi:hypothetical protein